MATKAQIEAAITARTTGSSTVMTWAKHAEMLKTETTSLLENIYPATISDISTGTKVVTTSNANFRYAVRITKIGRKVNMNGMFTALANVQAFQKVFDISLSEYTPDAQTYYATAKKIGTDTILVYVNPLATLSIRQSVILEETFYFDINYNTLN